MINRVILVGRLTRDPELRYTTSGVAVCRFSLAVNRNYTNSEGEREADFFDIVAWRGLGETVSNYCRKGRLVGVDGRLQVRNYETEDGRKVRYTEIVAENVQFLEPKNKGGDSAVEGATDNSFADDGKPIDVTEDDLPF